jgi:drug/metabolite transporter (DMT)-like permease
MSGRSVLRTDRPGLIAGDLCEDRAMTTRGLVLFVLLSVIWGIPYLFIRIAVAEVSPAFFVFARTGIAAAVLLPIALARIDFRPVLAHWRWVVAFAVVEIAIPWVMLGSAEQHLSSSLTGLLISGVPLVGTLLAWLTGGADRIGRLGLVGLAIGMIGVLGIVGADFGVVDPIAFVQVAIVVVGYAIGPAILSRRLDGVASLGVMTLSLGLVAIVYAPIAAMVWPATAPTPNVIVSLVVLGVVCSAAAFLLFAALIDEIGPVRATVIAYVNPAVAAVLGVLVLNETLTVPMVIGFALVTIGSLLATRRHAPAAAPQAVPAEA